MSFNLQLRTRRGYLVAALLGGFAAATPSQASRLDLATLSDGLVRQFDAVGGHFELPGGAMIYQSQADEKFTRGYRPEQVATVVGTLRREIYDLPKDRAAFGVFQQVRQMLQSAGFTTRFECERKACGDVEGWRLHLTPLVGGSQEAQYYYLGSAAKTADVASSHVAIYINELDGQSRLLVDYVVPDPVFQAASQGRTSAVSSPIFFPRGSDVPTAADRSKLRALSKRINAAAPEERFVVLGHADSDGPLLANIALSNQRAQRIRDILVNTHGVPAERLVAQGFGAIVPTAANASAAGKAANRRVEIIKTIMPAQ